MTEVDVVLCLCLAYDEGVKSGDLEGQIRRCAANLAARFTDSSIKTTMRTLSREKRPSLAVRAVINSISV